MVDSVSLDIPNLARSLEQAVMTDCATLLRVVLVHGALAQTSVTYASRGSMIEPVESMTGCHQHMIKGRPLHIPGMRESICAH